VQVFEHASFEYYITWNLSQLECVSWHEHLFAPVVIMFPLGDLSRYGQKKKV
jgi:hypothetical protein